MRVGRNDPCPCDSGKKFKRCCGATDDGVRRFREDAPMGEPVSGWARAHAIWPKTREVLLEHGRTWLGLEGFAQAVDDFPLEITLDDHGEEPPTWVELFFTWQLYDWVPEGEDVTVAQHWLENAPATGEIFRMIRSANLRPLSFYQVQAVDRGRGAVLRNLLADEEGFVVDRSLSEMIPPWTVLFARLVDFGGITFFEGVGSRVLPPHVASSIVSGMDEALAMTPPIPIDELHAIGTELVEIYAGLVEEDEERRRGRPVLHTTDGELLVLCEDRWRIEDGKREEVLGRLRGLGFEADTDGESVSFRWIRQNGPKDPLPSVHLGTVTVAGGEVKVETRSRERHARLKEQVTRALGSSIEHTSSEERDQSEVFDQMAAAGDLAGSPEPAESIPPELQRELMGEFLARHYGSWPDIGIPALDGKTPREAMKTPAGRSKVESLVRDMEFRTHGSPMEGAYDFDELRKELGLPEAG